MNFQQDPVSEPNVSVKSHNTNGSSILWHPGGYNVGTKNINVNSEYLVAFQCSQNALAVHWIATTLDTSVCPFTIIQQRPFNQIPGGLNRTKLSGVLEGLAQGG